MGEKENSTSGPEVALLAVSEAGSLAPGEGGDRGWVKPEVGGSRSMDPHEAYFRSLKREELQLLALREILYEGCWDEMVSDLLARKEGKPYVFKLKTRIDEDLQRIEKLRAYEAEHGVSLGTYVERTYQSGGVRQPK